MPASIITVTISQGVEKRIVLNFDALQRIARRHGLRLYHSDEGHFCYVDAREGRKLLNYNPNECRGWLGEDTWELNGFGAALGRSKFNLQQMLALERLQSQASSV